MMFSGGTYEMASLSAQMTGSYLFTDLRAKWAIIEHDRKPHNAETEVWSPFAKAVQNSKLHYLNNLSLDHALKLRTEGRLENLRSFLTQVWERVRGDEPFNEQAAVHLANGLMAAIGEADAEWDQIKKDIVKYFGASASAGAISAGPAIAAGHAMWLAAAWALPVSPCGPVFNEKLILRRIQPHSLWIYTTPERGMSVPPTAVRSVTE